MRQTLKHLADFRGVPMNWLAALAFFTPAFFLILKSTATTSLFLMFFICSWSIIKTPRHYFAARGSQFWALLVCLLIPFFAELFAQMGRGEIVGSSLDGPSRMIMAAGVFVYLSRFDCSGVIKAFSYGSAFGIFGVCLSIVFFPDYYWGSRAATYFVDPITLPCFTVALLGLFLFSNAGGFSPKFYVWVKLLLTLIVLYISIEASSRSGWVALAGLLVLYVIYFFRYSFKAQVFGVIGLVAALMAIYFLSDSVYSRVNESVSGVLAFFVENGAFSHSAQETSSGQRLILGVIDLHLIKSYPLFGFGDRTTFPSYESLLLTMPYLTQEIYEIKVLAGSHSEILAQLVRQGIIFGALTLCSLFLYPIYLCAWKYRKLTFSNGNPMAGVLGFIIPILASALTIQVFNLKMTISFYGLCLAIFFAYLCWQLDREQGN